MSLEPISKSFAIHSREEYEAKRARIMNSVDPATEFVRNGEVRCRKCYWAKVYDEPSMNFITRCACKCEVDRWEREREAARPVTRAKASELRRGDYNPFDGGEIR